jgi:hypothetical protein
VRSESPLKRSSRSRFTALRTVAQLNRCPISHSALLPARPLVDNSEEPPRTSCLLLFVGGPLKHSYEEEHQVHGDEKHRH